MRNPQNPEKEYLRVSEVLYPFSGLGTIDKSIVDNAARRGTKVHKICEAIIEGLGEIGVDDEAKGYVESFKKWWLLGHEVYCMEHRFWDDTHDITGQVDLIIENEDGLSIVDLKTSYKPSKTWPNQLSAYALLARNTGLKIDRIMIIHLNKHGKDPTVYEYEIDTDLFLEILKIYKYFFTDTIKNDPINQ